MRYTERPPCERLRPYVRAVWLLEGRGAGTPEPVFPDGYPEIILHFGDRFELLRGDGGMERQPRALVCGQLRSGIWLRSTGTAGVIGARLHPAALRDLTGVSGQELANAVTGLSGELAGDELIERLYSAETAEDRILIFESALIREIRHRSSALVRGALSLMASSGGSAPVGDVARRLNASRRTLERRFLEDVGLTPKEFSRVARFRAALDHMAKTSIAEAAAASGYFDQSHLIRDFQEFAGCTPGQYLRREFTFGAHLSHLSNTGGADSR